MSDKSYEKVHYRLRPAKNIQRKMLIETFRRLTPFGTLKSYRYVGLGSLYFSDFELIHKLLGISDMICVEREIGDQERFESNIPFRCVEMQWGDVKDILPALSWETRSIVWLDYDDKLDADILATIKFFFANAPTGSVIAITVDSEPEEYGEDRLEALRARVGINRIPAGFKLGDLDDWGLASVSARIINNEIIDSLHQKNGLRSSGSLLKYKQLYNLRYSDGTRMLTVGGLVFDEGQEAIVNRCSFDSLSFVPTDDEPYSIEVPYLTYKEIRHLNSQLPTVDPNSISSKGIPVKHIRKYEKIYQYFPAFVEAEI